MRGGFCLDLLISLDFLAVDTSSHRTCPYVFKGSFITSRVLIEGEIALRGSVRDKSWKSSAGLAWLPCFYDGYRMKTIRRLFTVDFRLSSVMWWWGDFLKSCVGCVCVCGSVWLFFVSYLIHSVTAVFTCVCAACNCFSDISHRFTFTTAVVSAVIAAVLKLQLSFSSVVALLPDESHLPRTTERGVDLSKLKIHQQHHDTFYWACAEPCHEKHFSPLFLAVNHLWSLREMKGKLLNNWNKHR